MFSHAAYEVFRVRDCVQKNDSRDMNDIQSRFTR